MGVYVAHDYRRLGVGRALVEDTLEHLPWVVSCTDDPRALRFFDAVGIPPG
jgi:GNAT superfamily N-acetyltransferase